MSLRRCLLLEFAAFSFAASLSGPAWACPPPLPGLYSSVPEDGATYPGNAVLFFSGHQIALDAVTVTVDGTARAFIPADSVVPSGIGGILVKIDPPPAAGQNVTIEGDFCPPGSGCSPVSIHFTAAPPDTTAPPAASALSFDIYDYLDFKSSGGDCQIDSDLGWWVTIDGAAASAGEAPVMYVVDAFRDPGLQDLAFSKTTFVTASTTKLVFRNLVSILNAAAVPDALCFRVSAFDAAGNAATAGPDVVCKPCRYRVDNNNPDPFLPPAEPAWTDADIFPGGLCALGTTTGSGGGATAGSAAGATTTGSGAGAGGAGGVAGNDDTPGSSASCTCRAARAREASPAGLLALAAAAIALVRCRRRRR